MYIEIEYDDFSRKGVTLCVYDENSTLEVSLINEKMKVEESTIEQLIDGARKCCYNNGESELDFINKVLNIEMISDEELRELRDKINNVLYSGG